MLKCRPQKIIMRNFTIYLALILCLFASKIVAQETFEAKAKTIALKIENITKDEKNALKIEINAVNRELESAVINKQQADEKKMELAVIRSKNIETRVSLAQEELKDLVQQKVDGKLGEHDTEKKFVIADWKFTKDSLVKINVEKRTTTQLVLATGFNNLVTKGSIANSDFGYLRSVFFEWGLTFNSKLIKDNNLLRLKYGLTGVYNHIYPTDNRYFVEVGNQTVLQTHPLGLKSKETYFKNVFVTIPVHLEFDFSNKQENGAYKSQRGFRFGVGGFVGYNTNSKQFLGYTSEGHDVTVRQKGNWNISDWNYGLSTYIGYKGKSLYLKYDLNPMFSNNAIKQNNISLGVRFDFN